MIRSLTYLFFLRPAAVVYYVLPSIPDNYPSADRPTALSETVFEPGQHAALHPPPSKPLTPILALRFTVFFTHFFTVSFAPF